MIKENTNGSNGNGNGRKQGRPSKVLDEEVRGIILTAIVEGNYREVAAKFAGVSPETLSTWMNTDREPYTSFRQEVLKAEAISESNAIKAIIKAGDKDARHYEWYLARKFPERWSNTDRIKVEVDQNLRIVLEVLSETLDDKTREIVLEKLANYRIS